MSNRDANGRFTKNNDVPKTPDGLNGKARAYKRDENGRFANGSSGGPGRESPTAPPKLLKDAIQKRLTGIKLDQIIDKLIVMAETGDKDAIRLLFEHCYGKPIQRTEIDANLSGGITVQRNTPRPKEE